MPATKTFTTQLAALAVLAIGLGADLDPRELQAVPAEVQAILGKAAELSADLDAMVAELAGVQWAVVSARGLAYSAALELALKLKEACYLHAMGLLRGPAARPDRGGRRPYSGDHPGCRIGPPWPGPLTWRSGWPGPEHGPTASAVATGWPAPACARCPARGYPSGWLRSG